MVPGTWNQDSQNEASIMRLYELVDPIWIQVFPFNRWPTFIKLMFLNTHKNYRDRHAMIMFFINNGLDPVIAYNLTLMHNTYSQGDHNSVLYTVRRALSTAESDAYYMSNQWYFDLTVYRWTKLKWLMN